MDKKLHEKFGNNFKTGLHLKADSLFLANHVNDTINYWDCDKEPKFDKRRIGPDGIDVEVNLPIEEKREEWTSNGKPMFAVHRPFVDIQFAIDKTGSVSSFKRSDSFPQQKEKGIYDEQLFNLAVQEIKTNYSNWNPAEIRGVKVNAFYVLRVKFKKAQ